MLKDGGEQVVSEHTRPVGTFGTVAAVLMLVLGSGVVVFIGAGLVAWGLGLAVDVALVAAGGAVLLMALVWFWRIEGLFWESETVKTLPLVPVEQSRPMVSVEVLEPTKNRVGYLDLPGSPAALSELARGLLSGRTFAESEWCGARRPYSRADFRALRAQLLERGLLTWRNSDAPTQGVTLSAPGRAVFRMLAEEMPRTSAYARPGDGKNLLGDGE